MTISELEKHLAKVKIFLNNLQDATAKDLLAIKQEAAQLLKEQNAN